MIIESLKIRGKEGYNTYAFYCKTFKELDMIEESFKDWDCEGDLLKINKNGHLVVVITENDLNAEFEPSKLMGERIIVAIYLENSEPEFYDLRKCEAIGALGEEITIEEVEEKLSYWTRVRKDVTSVNSKKSFVGRDFNVGEMCL